MFFQTTLSNHPSTATLLDTAEQTDFIDTLLKLKYRTLKNRT